MEENDKDIEKELASTYKLTEYANSYNKQIKALTSGIIGSPAFESMLKQQEYMREITSNLVSSSAFSTMIAQKQAFQSALKGIDFSYYSKIASSIVEQVRSPQMIALIESATSISKVMGEYLQNYESTMQNLLKGLTSGLTDIFKDFDFSYYDDKINYQNIDALKRFFWVVPFEYTQKQLDKINEIKVFEFNRKMDKHFTDKRVKRMFNSIRRKTKERNKKEFIKQCEENYFNGNYAICITGMITYLDSLTLELLDESSTKKHMSYKIIGGLRITYGETSGRENLIKYLSLCVADNFYDTFYGITELKPNNSTKLKRSINSHGVRYSNTKIDGLRVVNAVKFTQDIIEEVKELKDSFIIKNEKVDNKTIPIAVINPKLLEEMNKEYQDQV